MDHVPNEDFGELRLQNLLVSLKFEQDEVAQREKAARRLERLTIDEEKLKREILEMEAEYQKRQKEMKNQNPSQQQQNNNNSVGRLNSSSQIPAPLQPNDLAALIKIKTSSNNLSHLSPASASASSGHTTPNKNNSSTNLTVAQKIAARVQEHATRGTGTANYTMPTSSSLRN